MDVVGTAVLAVVVIGLGWRMTVRLERLSTWVEDVDRQLRAWQAAHTHQIEELDRRMLGIEAAAANAEREARMVSGQVVELGRGVTEHLGVVEQLGVELLELSGRPASASPPLAGGAR